MCHYINKFSLIDILLEQDILCRFTFKYLDISPQLYLKFGMTLLRTSPTDKNWCLLLQTTLQIFKYTLYAIYICLCVFILPF